MAVLERIKTVQFRFQTALLAQHRGQLFRGVPCVGRGELFLYFSETCGQGRLVKDAPRASRTARTTPRCGFSNQQAEALEILVVRLDVTPEPRKDRREKREKKSKPGPRQPRFQSEKDGFLRQRDDRVRQAFSFEQAAAGHDGPPSGPRSGNAGVRGTGYPRRCSTARRMPRERCCSGAEDRPNHASLLMFTNSVAPWATCLRASSGKMLHMAQAFRAR